jgi:tetratricopeptide (TPR) repeat protein
MSSSLTFAQLEWPTATLGPTATVPMLHPPVQAEFTAVDPDPRMAEGFRRGALATVLPFARQSGYDRVLTNTRHEVAILEGERLRATFLLGLGGRLWSLVDLQTGRELLYSNSAIQYGNLAIRDAWFPGGVEWNVGLIGHTVLSCSPLHAARIDGPAGPGLRLWEFDRLRECVYRLDAWFDDETGLLCVRPEIHNPNPDPVDTYWWSTIAVPQTDDVRTIVPADTAWKFGFSREMRLVPVGNPRYDITWPAHTTDSVDYFFDLRQAARPWIAAVGASGHGLVQTSSAVLEGRKLFLWGSGPGGSQWQRWLSPLGGAYLEIQAGLARTQMEHVELSARHRVSWVETYGPLDVDPAAAAADWITARTCVEQAIAATQPDAWFARAEATGEQYAGRPVTALAHHGSGWGALERLRREAAGDDSLDLTTTPFGDDTLGTDQQPWVALLRRGAFPAADPLGPPASFQRSPGWVPLLVADGSWRALLHLGDIRWHAGDADGARAAWTASLTAAPNPWAWRNLGVAAQATGDAAAAARAYAEAGTLAPDNLDILLERLALPDQNPLATLTLIDGLPPTLRTEPRVRVAEAAAALDAGELERALATLTPLPEIATVREGDDYLADLWDRLQTALPGAPMSPLVAAWRARGARLPDIWNFRMVTKENS